MLPPGIYRTAHGSTMEISGKHGGISSVSFDWLEEDNACMDCEVEPYDSDGYMVWRCRHTGEVGQAKLELVRRREA